MKDLTDRLTTELREHKFKYIKKFDLEPNSLHGITFEKDGKTIKAVASNSQAEECGIRAGLEVYQLKSDGSLKTKGFEDILNNFRYDCTLFCGVPVKFRTIRKDPDLFEEDSGKRNCIDVNLRFLLARLFNFDVQMETFEADMFVELMWLAPWDFPKWQDYMGSLEKSKGYKEFRNSLGINDWKKPDLKPFKHPSTREEEIYYYERVLHSYDRQ